MGEYFEYFVSRIDAPQLDKVDITFFDQPVFNTPQLHDFLARIEKFKAHGRGSVVIWGHNIEFELELGPLLFKLGILCKGLGQQVPSIAQLCSSSLHLPSTLKCLDIREAPLAHLPDWQDKAENTQWLDLLHPFTGLVDLHLGKRLVLHCALALRELAGEQVTKVLPTLQNLFIEGLEPSGPIQEALGQFVDA